MDINTANMIDRIKASPMYHKMGMIASHLGVVRESSSDGRPVKGLNIRFDKDAMDTIIRDTKKMPGIHEILIEVREGDLDVGQDIMAVVIGGDTRPHVFDALIKAVDRIKKEASFKKEVF